MKSATQLALYGAIAMVLTRIFYVISSFYKFAQEDFDSINNLYTAFNTIDLLGCIAIVNFFYVLYKKQNSKSKQDE